MYQLPMPSMQTSAIEQLQIQIAALPDSARKACLIRELHRQHQDPPLPAPKQRRLDVSAEFSQLQAKRKPR